MVRQELRVRSIGFLIASLVSFAMGVPASIGLCQTADPKADERYLAVAWVQNAAEYRVLTEQTYRLAAMQLRCGVQDGGWTADEAQWEAGNYQCKPPAVILDLDETVLDNSAYNARNILDGLPFDLGRWNAWCQEKSATAVPGALEFVQNACRMGVAVFYVTNRRDEVRQATIENLKALNFPVDESMLLTRNDDAGRGGDKVSRRAAIAANYRIVLLIGDNLSDLCSGMDERDQGQRNETAARKAAWLGSRWIVLPNPVYGSWERALATPASALKTRRSN